MYAYLSLSLYASRSLCDGSGLSLSRWWSRLALPLPLPAE